MYFIVHIDGEIIEHKTLKMATDYIAKEVDEGGLNINEIRLFGDTEFEIKSYVVVTVK